jgi:hypothetical protein
MRAHGISGNLWRWVMNWLGGRQQRVVLNGRASSWKEVLSGVPQGSVLGPLLFLIFINDLDQSVGGVQLLRKFADDTKLGHKVSGGSGRGELQAALDGLCSWASTWGMEFNVEKCKVMHVGRGNPGTEYKMLGKALKTTEEEKDVGVRMQKSLKPSAQCAAAARTAQTVLSQIGRSFHYRDRHIFVRLYKNYVRPHLEFSTPAWSPWTEEDKKVIEDVQRRAVRMISGLTGSTYEEKLEEIGLCTLEERRHQADMLQVYKILHGHDKAANIFERAATGERTTRAAADPWNVKVPFARLELRRNFFTVRAANHWNKIPAELKASNSKESFKQQYKKFRRAALGGAST